MLKNVELAEKKPGNTMRTKKNAIMCDGWCNRETRYVGLYASQMPRVSDSGSENSKKEEKIRVIFMSTSAMIDFMREFESNDANVEAITFDARTHVSHFGDVFKYY